MSRKKYSGICHICGVDGPLSYEHVPPESAFNNYRVVRAAQNNILNSEWDGKRGEVLQRGSGAYTLCSSCNNKTGGWYAKEYASWAQQGLDTLRSIHPEDESSFYVRFEGYPLRLLKQVITMHFSTNSDGFADKHPELVRFVLNRDSRQLPSRYKVDLVLARGKYHRSTGVYCAIDLNTGGIDVASEIAHYPFSFVLRFMDNNMQKCAFGRYGPIEHFTDYTYNESCSVWLLTRAGHITNVSIPGDYRSPAKLQKARESAELEEKIERFNKGR